MHTNAKSVMVSLGWLTEVDTDVAIVSGVVMIAEKKKVKGSIFPNGYLIISYELGVITVLASGK